MQRANKNWLDFYYNTFQDGGMSTTGYKKNSKDNNRPYNIIPSSNITMSDVPHPVYGMDANGNAILMQPGQNYQFPSSPVLEIPIKNSSDWLEEFEK